MRTTVIKFDQKQTDAGTRAAASLTSDNEVVDEAVREYVDRHREEIQDQVRQELGHLDGSRKASVALITGLSLEEIDDLGGVTD